MKHSNVILTHTISLLYTTIVITVMSLVIATRLFSCFIRAADIRTKGGFETNSEAIIPISQGKPVCCDFR